MGERQTKRHPLIRILLVLAAFMVALSCVVGVMVSLLSSRPETQTVVNEETPEEVVVNDAMAQEPAPADSEPEPTEPVTVRLMMIGDILMHSRVIETGNRGDGTYNFDHLFVPIASDVAEADVAVLNQETILGGSAWPYSGYPNFNSPQEVGDAEAAVGFDVILKATNHTFDLGYDGIRSELAYWASAHPEMAVIGMADPDGNGIAPTGGTSPAGPYVYEKDGMRIALLNYTDVLNANVDPGNDHRVLSIMSEEGIRADVAAAREQADIVVVFAHWGEEYETVPVDSERYWAEVLYDAGVDVVVGGHPHVIQPVEVWGEGDHRMLVCWSVGNFVSTQNDAANMVGGMVKLTFVKDASGARLTQYEFIPTVTQKEPYSTNMCAYKLPDYTDELAARSTVSEYAGEGGTLGWYVEYCAQVLGASFDRDTLTVHGTL